MMKFKEKDKATGFYLYSKDHHLLFAMNGGFGIGKENQKSRSYVYEGSTYFDYNGTVNRFHPNSVEGSSQSIIPKRFVVIQMN